MAITFSYLKVRSDDPYFYLYYGPTPRPPSYFALELEEPEVGRVLRFDSLSKILSSGIRIGFTSGPASLLTALDQHVGVAYVPICLMSDIMTRRQLRIFKFPL